MASKGTSVEPVGSKSEIDLFYEVHSHYMMAKEDLEQRIRMKNGFDDVDKLYASHIDESGWPYSSMVFDPIPHTTILEKSGRLVGNKPKGRMVPREGGDTLGAYINNELLSFQWDDNTRLGEAMISKWIKMDQGTRKYGKKFGLSLWRYETRVIEGKKKVFYDGPDFKVCKTKDSLPNPSYETVQKWFQYRDYVTLDDLEAVNDAARSAPIYKNLELLRDAIKGNRWGKGDLRETQYQSKNKSMKGLTDYLGRDKTYKTVEIVTEYRPNRWITFSPKHGVVIRDIPNPYKHQEIPVVELCYYPLEDDLYGEHELEPIVKLVRAKNAHLSAYSDETAIRLRPPLMVNPLNVRMHTLEWNPEAKWLMNTPGEDVKQMQFGAEVSANFNSINNVMTGMALNALGESSQGVSSVNPQQDAGRVTATEVKDTAFQRNVRDNMNQIFLSEALKKQTMFWHSMNQQFMFQGSAEKAKIVRIVGRDAVEFFSRQGLADVRPTEEDAMAMAGGRELADVPNGPRFPVSLDGMEVPKFQPDQSGEGGNLIIEPGDLIGNYDYIPDIESMRAPSEQDVEQKLTAILGVITNPVVLQLLQAEGKRPKVSELLIKMFESTKIIKDAEAYFEKLPPPQPTLPNGETIPGGSPNAVPGAPTQGNGGPGGMEVGAPSVVAGQNPQLMGGSTGF